MSGQHEGTEVITDRERAVLVSIVDRIVPDDDGTPGAVAAGAHRYVERELADTYAHHLATYRRGFAALDSRARTVAGTTFDVAPSATQDVLLSELEGGDAAWFGPDAAVFFALVRRHVMEGLFADPAWGGNQDRIGWELIGYPGPRLVWEANDQQVVTIGSRSGLETDGGAR